MHLVYWAMTCKDKEFGGLEIRKLDVLDSAMLRKWL